jgi:hypothetical protein
LASKLAEADGLIIGRGKRKVGGHFSDFCGHRQSFLNLRADMSWSHPGAKKGGRLMPTMLSLTHLRGGHKGKNPHATKRRCDHVDFV